MVRITFAGTTPLPKQFASTPHPDHQGADWCKDHVIMTGEEKGKMWAGTCHKCAQVIKFEKWEDRSGRLGERDSNGQTYRYGP
jgi:hypothetical protein